MSFGMFTSTPTYSKQFKTVHMMYKEGDQCGNGQRETHINFICKPGILDSPPVLERISDDGCIVMIRWHTAAACPQAMKKGNDCKVIDDDLGLVFDLNPLKKDNYYKVQKDKYTYYLNVCNNVNGTLCDKILGKTQNAAACQEEEGLSYGIKLGEPNSELLYIDGMINLTYTFGTPYDDSKKTPRKTSITFLCDETMGIGHPEFVEEAHHAYSFRWYTRYACPTNAAIECLARDPHRNQQYDLSRLTKKKDESNWMLKEREGNITKIFYLNICHPVTSTAAFCPSHASVCLVESEKSKDSQIITNLGQMTQPPKFKSEGHIELVYTNGDHCTFYGTNTTYNTTIHFICSKGDDHFVYAGKQGRCQHTFLWETNAACPVEERKSENICSIEDPVTGVVYDLTYLKNKYYNVTVGNHVFQVSICGTSTERCQESEKSNDVAVCETDEKGHLKKIIGLANGYSLKMSEDKTITLAYNGTYNQTTGVASKVYISFKCNKQGAIDQLTFKQEEQEMNLHNYYFELSSAVACSSELIGCTFSDDNGNNYDLTPLIKRKDTNWEVIDSRSAHSDLQYHINFCVPVNPTSTYRCPDGAIGACQTSTRNRMVEGFNLGFFDQHPIVTDGKIVITYTGGVQCHDGLFNRTTKIILYCSEIQEEPVFIGESPRCEYIFSMHTPAACPLKDISGKDCALTVPNYGYHFDLSPLRRTTDRYQVQSDEYEYLLNVCGPIINPPPECSGSGACQTKSSDSSFAVDAGKSSTTLRYNNGMLQLVYESGKGNCHKKYNRSTIITFVCNREVSQSRPRFLSEKEDCTYLFEWPTPLVCVDHQQLECSVSSDTHHYDLSSLSLTKSNYFVLFRYQKYAIINVCRTLSPSNNSQKCSRNSSACIIEYDGNNISKTTNIGISGSPYLENDVLKLKYMFGDNCEHLDAKGKTRTLQAVIDFECDEQKLDDEPRFIGAEDCTYYFTWRHVVACPIQLETKLNDNCTVQHPITGFTFDLSPLKSKTFYRVKNNNHEFDINVCAVINNTTCGANSGSCQRDIGSNRKWNSGNYNSKLHFHENTLVLNYTNGEICHGKYERNTVIQFSCGVGNGYPSFVFESDDCTYYFSWETVHACDDKVYCVVAYHSQIIDLTSLRLDKGYHTAVDLTDDDDKYIINVCSPLKDANAVCRNSGVCLIRNSSEISLGRPHGPPFIDFHGYITVIYSDGSLCNDKHNNTARIIFTCNPDAGIGEPSLLDIDKELCHYLFTWETSLVCPENKSSSINDCKFVDANRGINIDLSPLRRKDSPYEVKGKRDGEKFTINVCDPSEFGLVSKCSSAGVCFHGMADEENYGSVNSATLSYNGEELSLTYSDGDDCPLSDTGKRSSCILFTCDRKEQIGSPVLHKQSSCIAVFKWKTSQVCPKQYPECTLMANNTFYDLRFLSSITHSWNVTDSDGNVYWLNVCKETKVDFAFGNSGVFVKNNNGTMFSLGTLSSWTLHAFDSGEIILSYKNGDKMCPGMAATSNIKFTCGKTMGIPKFVSGPSSSCEYAFTWETIAACAETRNEMLPMKDKKIVDSRFGYVFDMSALFNRTYFVEWSGQNDDNYVFAFNLNGVKLNTTFKDCNNAAVCQTKPGSFYRDIGSVTTEKFYLKGNELRLELISTGRRCGKNKDKNVTTIINFVCVSSAGVGKPSFYYESGDCDYLFEWETDLVCPKISGGSDTRIGIPKDRVDIKHVKGSSVSYTSQVVIAIILSGSLVGLIIFIVSKEERRNAVRQKIKNAFINVHLPRLCYRRANGETLLLASAASTSCHDESDVEILS